MKLPLEITSYSPEDTKKIALDLAANLKDGDVIALKGELGAGKTLFVKTICEYFNIVNSSSPSFAIVNEYNGDKRIYHFDFYRINKIEELYDLGIEEYLSDESAVTFIEWAEKFEEIIPRNHISIKIVILTGSERKINIKINE